MNPDAYERFDKATQREPWEEPPAWATETVAPEVQEQPAPSTADDGAPAAAVRLEDFYAYMPTHNYLYVHTREMWPAASVNGRIKPWPVDSRQKKLKPSDFLDLHRPVEQMVWDPSQPMLIYDKVMQTAGYARHPGATLFNLYRAPEPHVGDSRKAGPWLDHLRLIYADDSEHIERYLAFKVQNPGVKVNHALVLGGYQGIGKDTLLEPVRAAVGPWNWQDISPSQMIGRFNGWAKCVFLRISEARDLGDIDRFAFYEHSKTYLAAPPDVVRVDEKHLREHYIANVCGTIITTNNKLDGLFLPADDRRHYVAWSPCTRDDFPQDYWNKLYSWFEHGGIGHVVAHLHALDLTDFDPKAPPVKTPAFWAMVQANESPESGELRDVLDHLLHPAALTVGQLVNAAVNLQQLSLAEELRDRKSRRSMPHKLDRVGYVPVRNPDAEDGLYKIAGKRQTIYAKKNLTESEKFKAARTVS